MLSIRFLVLILVYALGCEGAVTARNGSIDRPDGSVLVDANGGADTHDDDTQASDGSTDAPLRDGSLDAIIPPDDGLPPRIFGFHVRDGEYDRVYFRSDKPVQASDANGFTVSGRTISEAVIISGTLSGHYFVLTEPLDFWDNNTLRYEGGSDLRDVADRPLSPFIMEYIENMVAEPTSSTDRYVTTGASGGGDGTSEGSAWTLEEAFDNATAGTTVWIKAGNYGDQRLQFPSGTAADPIKFVGYRDSIGDITELYYSYEDGELDASKMPLLDGSGSGGVAMSGGNVSYVIVRNIQARNYELGFYANNSTGVIFDGCIVKDGTGDFGGAFTHGEASAQARTLNSIAINGTGGNCSISGEHNLIRNVKSYSDNTSNPTDYYFGISGSNQISIDTYAYRTPGLSHSGHGMSVQTPATVADEDDPGITEYNLIIAHTGVNLAKIIEFRHGGARYNVGRNIVGYGPEGGSVEFRDDTSFNVLENASIESPNGTCIYFSESVEIGVGLGHDNLIRNLVCRNSPTGIYVASDHGLGSLTNNKFYNSVFYNVGTLFEMRDTYPTSGNEFVNNIVVNSPTLSNIPVPGWTFENSDFFNGFDAPSGPGNVVVDPGFVGDSDVHLTPGSPTEVTQGGQSLSDVLSDADNNKRSAPYSMGAFEY